ncbi:hypothetical protein N665_0988s0005 [Sinapis alba]|nr:hypothetical protein N665_0988s0005 [Sinapis alba]
MDSSSTPNRVQLDNEEEEFPTPDSGGKRKESPGASGATQNGNKIARILPTRSKIWNHYTRTKENRDKCVCHYCKKKFCCASKSGTSNLLKHLTVCKQYFAHSDGQSSTQQVLDEEGNLADAKVSEDTFREATNEMMVIGELPLAWIEEIAKDVLAMQVSSVASESAFSTSGRIIDPFRSCLTHFMVEVLMCTEQWLKQDIHYESRVLTNEQILGDIEEQEKIERGMSFYL